MPDSPSWRPKLCAVCGKHVKVVSGFWNFNVKTGEKTALHHECVKAWVASRHPADVIDSTMTQDPMKEEA